MKLLIVGGAGYFGARLATALKSEHSVTVTQRSTSAARTEWVERTGLQTCRYDSAENETLPTSDEFDAIINLAMPGAAEAGRDPEAAKTRASRTVQACIRLLEEGRAQRLIHFSTFHVYGGGGRGDFDESDAPAPIHPYGETHLLCEQLLKDNDKCVVLRPSNMVGAPAHADLGDQSKLLFIDLCQQAAHGSMKLHNDGLSYRNFLPFGDAISAVRLLLEAKMQETRLFNLASGAAMRLDAVSELIRSAAPQPPVVEFGTGKDAFREPFTVNVERLSAMGWQPQASLFDEAVEIIRFFA